MNLLPKHSKNLLLVVLISLVTYCKISAQEIVASAGESLQSSTTSVAFTLGELAISTETSGNIIITQGFHQSFSEITEALAVANEAIAVSVFPNPSSDFLNIISESDEELQYILYNLLGSKVASGAFVKNKQLNIEHYAKATYLLLLTNKKDQLIQSFKIQFR